MTALLVIYPWVKALHVIAIIAWMAGMLYLPRLFAYHADVPVGSPQSELFKVMERKLLRIIINPAMIAALLLGILLLLTPGVVDWSEGWIHLKLTLVAGLFFTHHRLVRWRKHFDQDRNTHSSRFYRAMNEVPTLLMIGIVIAVIVKPF